MNLLFMLVCALVGTVLGACLACVPALHVYNVAALLVLSLARLEEQGPSPGQAQALAMGMLGMTVGYAMVNTVPSLFVAAPDESAVWIVLPGQRYLLQGRGYEAAVLTGLGGLGGVFLLVLLSPLVTMVLAPIRRVLQPHLHALLGLIALYVVLSEWPKGAGRGASTWARLWDGTRSILAGLVTFVGSGMLGLVLTYRSFVPLQFSFQGLMPAFIGLFALPWIVQNLLSRTLVPRQYVGASLDVTPGLVARGVGAGTVGGLLAAFFPAVTAGMGGLIAGHATAQRDERVFLISQGASKVVYYAGALLLFFAPGVHLRRGGMAWLLSPFYTPYTPQAYWLTVAATALCGALSFFLLLGLSRVAAALVGHVDFRWLSWGTLALLLALVVAMTGWGGLMVALVATGIGLIPVLFHARRMNCMGVVLLPMLLNMSGLGAAVATWFGLA